MTVTAVDEIAPTTRTEARVLARTEYERLADQLRSLTAQDWRRPTDCPGWDVRAVAGHCVGMLSDFSSYRSMIRRVRAAEKAAARDGGPMVDSMTALQVSEYAPLSVEQLIDRVDEHGPKAARWRTRVPFPLRAMPMKEEVGGRPETWRLGFLLDTILTRDPWMHRVDIARATGHDLVLTADHDGRIVAGVVAEWARRHGRPFELELTGPAGGRFVAGAGDRERLHLDAVEFCRILSERAPGSGLLAQPVPF
ncbi:hypothetical protein GCM10009821_19250 [Aeromicrobium halocynthiae]|uniref:Mycothiol-dependent maleylpyruvate isomerase metal-binding domain-containing protein n=1 Tax=Aeromicrobium halocynthiae TaxID=560557 RepID=A0ABN2W2G9_9ACTN